MYIISFSHYFVENAEQLSSKLNIPIVYYLQPDYIYHIFSAHDAAKQLLDFQTEHPNTKYIIYQSENVDSCFFNKNYIQLMKQNTVYQYSPMIAKYCLNKYGIECGSYFSFDYPYMYDKRKKDIDLLFFGTLTKKRVHILNEIQRKFNIIIVSNVFGKDMENMLLRTKYVINISEYDNNALETHRINKALSCGCKVISNPSCDEHMNRKYTELIRFTKGRTISDYMKCLDKIFNKEEKGHNGDIKRD
jgi:hypothetical protein